MNLPEILRNIIQDFKSMQTAEVLFSPEQKLGMRSAMKLLLSALPITIRPTSKIHYFARSVK
jgi:hypothetical protein